MKTNKELRAEAREMLGGNIFASNWLMAFVVALILGAINGGASSIPGASLILTGPLMVGAAGIFLKMVREKKAVELENIFKGFSNDFGENLLLGLMITIFTALWTFLFIIPGIVKAYAYSMAYYIRSDHPEYDWSTCIKESQTLMQGNKGKLFLLDLSLLGWWIVGFLACGIGALWVSAYANTIHAAFYHDLVGDPVAPEFSETI